MKSYFRLAPAAIAAVLWIAPAPAFAQHDRGGQGDQHARGGQAQPRNGGERGGAAQPRAASPQQRGGEQRGAEQRGGERGTRGTAGRVEPRAMDRGDQRGDERGARRGGYAVQQVEPRSRVYGEPRSYGYERPRVEIPLRAYPRPYYAFRPRVFIGYGIYLGYPVPYPVMYGDPTYAYAPTGEIAAPVAGDYGGVSFDISPSDATVSVDGYYVGTAADFSPENQPLTLTPGRHHVEIQEGGMVPLAFDVDIVPGQVLPYRGALQPY